jgi:hypothetical protein
MVKRLLVLSANPRNMPTLNLEREIREIREALQRSYDREQFVLETRGAVRRTDLRRALIEVKPHIVHFCGHGAGQEGLVLEDEPGNAKVVTTEALSDLFRLSSQVECVLLNACYSQSQADEIVNYVDYVIGMNHEVGDAFAIIFAIGFYDALGAGESIEQAFEIGRNAVLWEMSAQEEQAEKISKDQSRKFINSDIKTDIKNLKNQEHLIPILRRKAAVGENEDDLRSRLGADYRRLRDLLASREWQKADRETNKLFQEVISKKRQVELIPCQDLWTVDQLWNKYSSGSFSFSKQHKVWQKLNTKDQSWKDFYVQIGWMKQREKILGGFNIGKQDEEVSRDILYNNLTGNLSCHFPLLLKDIVSEYSSDAEKRKLVTRFFKRLSECNFNE